MPSRERKHLKTKLPLVVRATEYGSPQLLTLPTTSSHARNPATIPSISVCWLLLLLKRTLLLTFTTTFTSLIDTKVVSSPHWLWADLTPFTLGTDRPSSLTASFVFNTIYWQSLSIGVPDLYKDSKIYPNEFLSSPTINDLMILITFSSRQKVFKNVWVVG